MLAIITGNCPCSVYMWCSTKVQFFCNHTSQWTINGTRSNLVSCVKKIPQLHVIGVSPMLSKGSGVTLANS